MSQYYALLSMIYMISFVLLFDRVRLEKCDSRFVKNRRLQGLLEGKAEERNKVVAPGSAVTPAEEESSEGAASDISLRRKAAPRRSSKRLQGWGEVAWDVKMIDNLH